MLEERDRRFRIVQKKVDVDGVPVLVNEREVVQILKESSLDILKDEWVGINYDHMSRDVKEYFENKVGRPWRQDPDWEPWKVLRTGNVYRPYAWIRKPRSQDGRSVEGGIDSLSIR